MSRLLFRSLIGVFCLAILYPCQTGAQSLSLRERALRDPYTEIISFIKVQRQLLKPISTDEISTCELPDEEWPSASADNFLIHMPEIAFDYVYLYDNFSKAGYPPGVWKKSLDDLLWAQIRNIVYRRDNKQSLTDINSVRRPIMPYERALANVLNDYRPELIPLSADSMRGKVRDAVATILVPLN
jgi:hypothetical protein